MSTRNPYVTYFSEVKQKAAALKKLNLSDENEILTPEQERAIDEFKEAADKYLLDTSDGKVNRRGLNTLTRNGFPAYDISGQPSNEDSDGAFHTGVTIEVGERTIIVERDDC